MSSLALWVLSLLLNYATLFYATPTTGMGYTTTNDYDYDYYDYYDYATTTGIIES